MKTPCQIVSQTLITPLKVLVAHRLYSQGLSQNKIAKKLKTSQVSVNRFLRKEPERVKKDLIKLGLDSEKLELYINNIIEDINFDDTFTLCLMCRDIQLHKFSFNNNFELFKQIDSEQNLHHSLFPLRLNLTSEKIDVLARLNKAARTLEKNMLFTKLIPDTGSDLVFSVAYPVSTKDVAGIPSKIIKYHGHPKKFIGPEFGVNSKVSTMLLKINRYNEKIQSGINIIYDEKILKILKNLNLKIYKIDKVPAQTDENFSLVRIGKIDQPPSIFLFSKTPETVIEIIEKLLKSY